MIVRPAVGTDAARVAALERTLFGVDAWSPPSVAAELCGDDRFAVVAVDGEQLLGYAVTMRTGDVVDLQRLAVAPSYQRRGVARALLGAVTDRAGAEGAEAMLLEVSAENRRALGLYTAAGFGELDRRARYYRDGSDALVLRRPLGRVDHDRRG